YRSRSDFIAKNMSTFEWLDVFHDLFRRSLSQKPPSSRRRPGSRMLDRDDIPGFRYLVKSGTGPK
ncbi:MAG: hypothetical protein AB2690_04995, partial [Candidatus Thiodiazotropha endolucinida]